MSTPFAWQDKRVLRIIREQAEEYSSAVGVYVALTVAASDLEKTEFQTTHAWLAQLSGLGERTVKRRIADLKRIGVISVTTPRLKAPCTYRLLGIASDARTIGHHDRTLGHSGPTIGNDGTAIGHGTAPSVAQIRRNQIHKKEALPQTPDSCFAEMRKAVL